MSEFDSLLQGMNLILTPGHIGLMVIGVLLGILVGVLPGLGAPNGVALLLPLTFTMSPVSAIILLSCMYWGALFGGSITSILFNIPGEPSSVATTFDGYPMAREGRAAEALTAAFSSALIGALAGVLLLTFLSTRIAEFAMSFSSPEFFAVYLLAFCTFIGMSKNPPLKTVVSMMIGFAMAAVGMDTVSGNLRLTFDQPILMTGISFEVAVIGLFGIGEILCTVEEGLVFRGEHARITPMVILRTWAKLPRYWLTIVRSTLVGCWMGITPGGPTAASFMGYSLARRFSKNRDNFGKGEIEGVIAPETADHAAGTSALLPMLTLGIPGSATAAVMLGGLMIWGLHPGPTLFVEQHDFVWGLIASMYLGNVVSLLVVLATVPLFASILRIPFSIIAPIIIMVCAIGAYSVHNSLFDVGLMLGFGALGYLFKKLGYPIAPLVLAAVLGDKAEDAFRQSMLFSDGQLGIFWSNPLVGSLTTAALIMLFWPLISGAIQHAIGWRARHPAKPKSIL
ncbi:TctA family transporter [Pseudomonas sp. JUb42]|jgi:TctA family transporter|uniref:tripartite tricarboxylate transporter permease n=1 Tax=Pseudomonas sp. JUb42 TaxID=2940611 RepID=UPI002169A981|nr:tripartite tricarboxylate transporter permease [Pseudomonas sp. JUb42]MCS3469861.1 TctA family transporter [Pseudomonas sp. JUb42]